MSDDQIGYRARLGVKSLPSPDATFSSEPRSKRRKRRTAAEIAAEAEAAEWDAFEAACRQCAADAFRMTPADRKKYLAQLAVANPPARRCVGAIVSEMHALKAKGKLPLDQPSEDENMSEGIDLSDAFQMPVKQKPQAELHDDFQYELAFKFAFVGVGQGGSRIAETFAAMGYARACAINTTGQDLAGIQLPDYAKLDLGSTGAGKDPKKGLAAVEGRSQDIRDLFARAWGRQVDQAFVCFGAGGGTGAGAFGYVLAAASTYMNEIGKSNAAGKPPHVGAIVALPKDAEGSRPAANALAVVQELASLNFSPIIVIDNQKIQELYPSSVTQEYPTANKSVASLLHQFNRIAGSNSDLVTFDREDFASLLASGQVAFAVASLTEWSDKTAIAKAVRDQLNENMLVSTSVLNGSMAGLIFVLNGKAYDEFQTSHLDYCVEMLNGSLKGANPVVYQGVYKGTETPKKGGGGSVQVLAMIGGLPWPKSRLEAMATRASVDKSTLAEFLDGV